LGVPRPGAKDSLPACSKQGIITMRKMSLSQKTNHHHLAHIYEKLQESSHTSMTPLFSHFWPQHEFVRPREFGFYLEISRWLDDLSPERKIALIQDEEDWFIKTDWDQIRSIMSDHPNWTPEKFVISTSRHDVMLTKEKYFSNIIWRPSLLDLLSYLPYDETRIVLCAEKITHYTGCCYSNSDHWPRTEIISQCTTTPDKFSLIDYKHIKINNLDLPRDAYDNKKISTPWVDIDIDFSWMQHNAFALVCENFNRVPWAPTISEKVYKNMHLLRPALIFGAPGVRTYLKNLGFDTWDWFIDWEFDVIVDPWQRLEVWNKELDRLLHTPLSTLIDLLEKHQTLLYRNRDLIFQHIINYKDLDWNST